MREREKYKIAELKLELYEQYGYTCQNCGGSILQYNTPQLAHRVAQTAANISRYGKEAIHSKRNLAPVCSLKCNDAMNIGNKPEQAKKLLKIDTESTM